MQTGEPLFATPCYNTSRATWSTPSEPPHKKPFFEVLSFSAVFGTGCCCQLVCFEFGVLHFRLPLYTRNGQMENTYSCCGIWLRSWLAAVVNLFVLNVVLHFRWPIPETLYPKRADCRRTRTTCREETKKTLPRRPGPVAPRGAFSCRCANAAILNATSRAVHTKAFPLHCSVGRLLLRVSSTKASKHQSRCTRTQIECGYNFLKKTGRGMLRRSRRVLIFL